MKTQWLHLRAPFAAFRWMQAGVYRATSPVIPPSAAWGLVLNLAGIDVRPWPAVEKVGATLVDPTKMSLAIGSCSFSSVSTLYQQLHSYPVGNSGQGLAKGCHGAKYWIAPVRREVLVGFEAVVGIRANSELFRRVRLGLEGNLEVVRHGLPFAGDNSFLFDTIELKDNPPKAYWYTPADKLHEFRGTSTCRLTVYIDREDASRTVTKIFAQSPKQALPSESSWIEFT